MSRSKAEMTGSTRDFVYQRIKEQIINLELTPGTKISEQEMAGKLEVSRTPVREAFFKLAQEDLLVIIPQSGTIVSKIDLDLVEEGRFLREHIEKAIVREVCKKANQDQLLRIETNLTMQEFCLKKGTHQRLFELDEEFHELLFDICQKKRTWKIIRQMNSHLDRLRILRLAINQDWTIVVEHHQKIFEAISSRNEELAEETMATHMSLVIVEKDQLRERYPEFFSH
ncbi:GntR family transcriptional regulator [Halalkalibacterium halodurans]|uniref:Transcriptional regulator (GntR family) n=1 Tax=Halalkalibacterium halodurans (strain ATCC BAA-125 / DSM 18197 / FERM 7344 / JCM 9153 / C-125) TaxID=272558 RepID=Q9KDZ9_HALH5|nr:GntR family transcriptional regulator [Halalkalibacterium halodurans]MED4124098.1 GntR family transcriptional regulator [Halalkalibacterium halodurans]MED4174593.1 GntR family transcriptional regulator [Halalkalibacterium halodurans]BAB04781.1 transcriptional regulator (GntR family) [Halalkalibacterium halodurans C-125]